MNDKTIYRLNSSETLLVYIVREWLVYILWLFYIVRVYSIFQAEFFCGIFVFLLQIILAESLNI